MGKILMILNDVQLQSTRCHCYPIPLGFWSGVCVCFVSMSHRTESWQAWAKLYDTMWYQTIKLWLLLKEHWYIQWDGIMCQTGQFLNGWTYIERSTSMHLLNLFDGQSCVKSTLPFLRGIEYLMYFWPLIFTVISQHLNDLGILWFRIESVRRM